jgi:hypothetical protein
MHGDSPAMRFRNYRFHVYSVLGLLHCVVMDDVADVSEVHAASIFRVEY